MRLVPFLQAKAAAAEKDRERQNAERRKERELVMESELAYMDGMIEELKLNETPQSTQSEEYYCPICKKRFRWAACGNWSADRHGTRSPLPDAT